MRYYIADSHFFHGSLNEKMDKRGFPSVEAMNFYMLEKWNSRVRAKDEVVILGDLSWGSAEETNELLEHLNGKLYLIKGNHDRFGSNKKYNDKRFVWIKSYAEIHDNNRKVILCHYPIMCYNGQYRWDRNGKSNTYMLYGHVHDTMDQRLIDMYRDMAEHTEITEQSGEKRMLQCNMINCFCKYSDYTPLTLDEWIELTERRRREGNV